MRSTVLILLGLWPQPRSPAVAQTARGAPAGSSHLRSLDDDDSLSQVLSLTPAQRTKITPAYTALNG